MRRLVIILTLCAGGFTAASAQTSFTQQLQRSHAGEGKITITQDKAIDDLVNGRTEQKQAAPATPQKTPEKTPSTTAEQKKAKPEKPVVEEANAITVVTPDTTDNRKKIMKGYKVTGYRVQVFAGGNSRNDRLKAERMGDEVKALFPEEPIYVHFYSPRWICRMGNYRTYEEAHEILSKVKKLGYDSAIIVKGKITVQYP